MKKKLINILLGIKDGVFPSVENSVKRDEKGTPHLNTARMVAGVLSWLVMIAALLGFLPWESVLAFLKMLLMAV